MSYHITSTALRNVAQKQALPLEAKIMMSKQRIREWYNKYDGEVYVAFSGGKDSTVLLHLVRSMYPNVPAVFCDTGLEYPEVKQFVRQTENVTIIRPKMSFPEVIDTYGYPVVSKQVSEKVYLARRTKNPEIRHKYLYVNKKFGVPPKWHFLMDAPFKIAANCCDWLKKKPAKEYAKQTGKMPIMGVMAKDSELRLRQYAVHGCNHYDGSVPRSHPLSFWAEHDVWSYLNNFNVPYSKIYDMGADRTGCMFCMFGVHMERTPNRFQRMEKTHPQLHDYCINKLGCGKVMDYIGVPYDNSKEQLMLWPVEISARRKK